MSTNLLTKAEFEEIRMKQRLLVMEEESRNLLRPTASQSNGFYLDGKTLKTSTSRNTTPPENPVIALFLVS